MLYVLICLLPPVKSSGFHRLAHSQVGAHAEEEGEDHVVDENRLDEYVYVVHDGMC